LRYARNQKSPFEDEQDGNFILEPIVFEDGVLIVAKNNPVLQRFMELHPANGDVFYEFDTEKDASEKIEYLSFELDAQLAAREMNIESAEAVLRVMVGGRVDKMTSQEIRRDIMVYARNNPEEFLDIKLTEPKETAAGIPAVISSVKHVFSEMGPIRGFKALAKLNQKDGFDCPRHRNHHCPRVVL
jgi:hypothetical protein